MLHSGRSLVGLAEGDPQDIRAAHAHGSGLEDGAALWRARGIG